MIRSAVFALVAASSTLLAQDPQPQAEMIRGVDETWNLRWWGAAGRSYFLQASDDLVTWQFAPLIEGGNDEIIEYETGSLGERHFVRLVYTDQTAPDLDAADFDGDKLGNLAEITLHHTHPLKSDTDGDGLPDKWEIDHNIDPNDDGSINPNNGPNGDPDGDGSTNLQELEGGYDPRNAQDFAAQLIGVTRSGRANSSQGPHGLSSAATWSTNWNGYVSNQQALGSLLTFQILANGTAGNNFPAAPPDSPDSVVTITDLGSVNGQQAHGRMVRTQTQTASSSNGELQQTRVWVRSTATPQVRKYRLLKVTRSTSRPAGSSAETSSIDGVSVETFSIGANEEVSDSLDLLPEVADQPNTTTRTLIDLKNVTIKPAEGMSGIVGDMIASNSLLDPELHFVSPKKTHQLPSDFIVFEATNLWPAEIDPGNSRQIVQWEGGEAVDGEPLRRRVRRDQTGKTQLKIKVIPSFGGEEVSLLNCWVIWCSIGASPGVPKFHIADDGWSKYLIEPHPGWTFVFNILPKEIITDSERPFLHGYSRKPVPGYGKKHVYSNGLDGDSAANQWDVSRQLKVVVRNPQLLPKNLFDSSDMTWAFVNQPKVYNVAVNFPNSDVEGNDDPPIFDEATNPYVEVAQMLPHPVGGISSYDAPAAWAPDSWGMEGVHLSIEYDFNEFARVELWDGRRQSGNYWFRISDLHKWHHATRLRFSGSSGDWANNGSSAGNGHVNP